MQPTARDEEIEPTEFQSILVVSATRFLRESLAEILCRNGHTGTESATLAAALDIQVFHHPTLILLDSALLGGPLSATRIATRFPAARLIVFGIAETEDDVLAWVEAGVAGYVPNTASIANLLDLISGIARGEQACPSRIAGSLLRRLAANGRYRTSPARTEALTHREREILHLVGAGLSNKDIARRLSISLGTTKSHVHNLLGKLSLRRRTEVMVHVDRTQIG
jgi:two-component system, NarL family, nitrate/nitrite response regulator NarL